MLTGRDESRPAHPAQRVMRDGPPCQRNAGRSMFQLNRGSPCSSQNLVLHPCGETTRRWRQLRWQQTSLPGAAGGRSRSEEFSNREISLTLIGLLIWLIIGGS